MESAPQMTNGQPSAKIFRCNPIVDFCCTIALSAIPVETPRSDSNPQQIIAAPCPVTGILAGRLFDMTDNAKSISRRRHCENGGSRRRSLAKPASPSGRSCHLLAPVPSPVKQVTLTCSAPVMLEQRFNLSI
jgi:hypothetical protein